MQTVEELAAALQVPPEQLKDRLALIGLAALRRVAEQLADADAVESRGFEAVLHEPAPEPEHWRQALARLS